VQLGTTERIVDVIKRVAVLIATGSTGLAALRLFSAARVTGERIGVTEALPERAIYEQVIDDLRQRHEGAADAAWTAGARLDLAAAVTEARRHLHPETGGAEPAGASDSLGLSQREMDVLRLLGNGRSDAEIAAELGISRRTVTTHTGRIYAKLGVTSRTAAVATAMRNGVL
jgi:DNA-binding CsgD family transcriptional regulator